MEEKERKGKFLKKGGVNLVILGIVSTAIAIVTTGISMLVYHNSGDIYLDRSRPGFLPDEEEALEEAEDEEDDYNFQKTGAVDSVVLDEYLKKIQVEVDGINAEDKPFDEKVLLDEDFGIPKNEE